MLWRGGRWGDELDVHVEHGVVIDVEPQQFELVVDDEQERRGDPRGRQGEDEGGG